MDRLVTRAPNEIVAGPAAATPRTPHALRDALRDLQRCGPDADRQQVDACLDRVMDALDERIADGGRLFVEADLATDGPLSRLLGPAAAATSFALVTILCGTLASIAVAGTSMRLALIWAAVAAANLAWATLTRANRRRWLQAPL